MTKAKLFLLSFIMSFASTALLCMAARHPLIFLPVSYKVSDFIAFGMLIALLCYGLVFVTLPFLSHTKEILRITIPEKYFFIWSTVLILQILTLVTGYTESATFSKNGSQLFYYYKGVGNSHIYLLTGNITAIVIAALYASGQIQTKKPRTSDFSLTNPSS